MTNSCSTNFYNSLDTIPLWTLTSEHFICTDQKTGKELQKILRPLDTYGVPIPVFQNFNAWTNRDLTIDGDRCSARIYNLTKSMPTKSKRMLPAGSMVEIKITPGGGVVSHEFDIRTDHPGQENLLHINMSLFDLSTPSPLHDITVPHKKRSF